MNDDDMKRRILRDVENMLRIARVAYDKGQFEMFAAQVHTASQLLEHWYPRDEK